jgi:NAD(P)-dependent dehydrogenase (short-subunit alcohol dehydrogenase family)
MPSYVITGVSRGLGWEFLRQLSANLDNAIIGIVRDKATTDTRITQELADRSNITILQADISDYSALKATVAATSEVTGGKLDYLIANAGYVPDYDAYDNIGVLGEQPEVLESELLKLTKLNVISVIHLINLYVPLLLQGESKKVIGITSGHADIEPVRQLDQGLFGLYAISKCGLNMAIAKFSAQYKQDGILFLSLSPGVVDVGHQANATPEQQKSLWEMAKKFIAFDPTFRGPSKPEVACKAVIDV